jgi:hypothetical protein
VTFTPSASGTRSATLSIADSDPSSPQTIALSGTGSGPVVVLSPISLAFTNVPYLKGGTSMAAQLTNSGRTRLNITSIAITGPNANDFTQANTCGTSASGWC